jgi:hypothetical protein
MLSSQLLWAVGLSLYIIGVLFATIIPYRLLTHAGVESIRAVYYTRKIVHMFAGGIGSLAVPLVFTDFWYPGIAGLLLAVAMTITHWTGHRLYWFQIADNANDVKFAIMWALSISFLWWLLDDPWLAILPALYMAFGDGVTGIARNWFYRQRSKGGVGNLFMLIVCVPMGWMIGQNATPAIPLWGVISAVVATIIERYEIGFIDDNVLIVAAATAVLLFGTGFGPLL